jgi:hypothetical protein
MVTNWAVVVNKLVKAKQAAVSNIMLPPQKSIKSSTNQEEVHEGGC